MHHKLNGTRLSAAVAMLVATTNVHAVLVTETYQSTVTQANHAAFSVGDTFNWTVTYDDSSLQMHTFVDGSNGIGEFGQGDDTLQTTYCTGAAAGSSGCVMNYSTSEYSFFSDAVYDISVFYDVMSGAGLTGQDYFSINNSWVYEKTSLGYNNMMHQLDDVDFRQGIALTYYYDPDSGQKKSAITSYSLTLISSEVVGVPISSSATLMVLGLIGLGVFRYKKFS